MTATTNADKVLEIIAKSHQVALGPDDYTAQLICDAIGVDPEGEWVPDE